MKKKYHELRTEQKDKAQDMMHPGGKCRQVGEWTSQREMKALIQLKSFDFPWVFHGFPWFSIAMVAGGRNITEISAKTNSRTGFWVFDMALPCEISRESDQTKAIDSEGCPHGHALRYPTAIVVVLCVSCVFVRI